MEIETRISFSSNETPAALALLYLQQADLAGKSPSEIAQIYQNAFDEISDTLAKIQTERANKSAADFIEMMGKKYMI
ncbi:MAG: hypothetical protein K2O42_07435 [Oscillospiraceae bacterium]|nr:hypothetical protein [Oscillospiraceae bacterium]